MNDEQKYSSTNETLDRMVADYRSDMARWARENPAGPKHTDAATIARAMHELMDAQPTMSAWLLAVAVQRLGDGVSA
jgi:hypothetical protein